MSNGIEQDNSPHVVEMGPNIALLQQLAQRNRKRGNKYVAELLDQNAEMGEEHAAGYLEIIKAVGRVARRYHEEGKLLG